MASILWGQHGEVGGERGEVGINKNDFDFCTYLVSIEDNLSLL
jgi:hypothetical protein